MYNGPYDFEHCSYYKQEKVGVSHLAALSARPYDVDSR